MKRGLVILSALAVSALAVSRIGAAPPVLDSVFPPGGERGQVVDLTLSGKFEPWPCQLWFSKKGLTFAPDPKAPGKGRLTIDAAVPPGPVLLRAHGAAGASEPRLFIVGALPEMAEEEKDGSRLADARPIDRAKLPCVVNGTLSTGGELDAYRVVLEKGDTLHALVEAYGLRSLVDPALHLHAPGGHRLAVEHDGAINLDPLLVFTAPAKGDYRVALAGFSHPPAASVSYTGSKHAHYRLHLALRREDLPARLLPSDLGPDSGDSPLAPGKPLVGTLDQAGVPKRHSIKAKKGDKLLLRVEGRALGFPIDPVMRVLKADGSEIRKEDDSKGFADPAYLWTASADGDYLIEVGDRFGRAGEQIRYRLSASVPQLGFKLVAASNAFVMERGKALEVKTTLTRQQSHAAALTLSVVGLPASIRWKGPEKIPEKDGEIVWKFEAAADAPAFSGPVRLVAKDAQGVEESAHFSFQDDKARGPYAIDEVSELWLALPPLPEKKPDPAKPTSAKPTPAKPAPEKKPAPVKAKPAPAKPTPAKPAPAKPTPAKPAPANPAPAKPAADKMPVPAKPAPVKPAPEAKPVPAKPAPAKPTAPSPAAKPTPAEPTPAKP